MLRITQATKELVAFVVAMVVCATAFVVAMLMLPFSHQTPGNPVAPNLYTIVSLYAFEFFATGASTFVVHQSLWGFRYSKYILFTALPGVLVQMAAFLVLQGLNLWCTIGNDALLGFFLNIFGLIWIWGGLILMVNKMKPRKRYEVFILFALHALVTNVASTIIFYLVSIYLSIERNTYALSAVYLFLLRLVMLNFIGPISISILQRASRLLKPIQKGTEVIFYLDLAVFYIFVNRVLITELPNLETVALMSIGAGVIELLLRTTHGARDKGLSCLFDCMRFAKLPTDEEEKKEILARKILSYEDRLKVQITSEYVALIISPVFIGLAKNSCPWFSFGVTCSAGYAGSSSLVFSTLIQIAVVVVVDVIATRYEIKHNVKLMHSWQRHRAVGVDGSQILQSELNVKMTFYTQLVMWVTILVRVLLFFSRIHELTCPITFDTFGITENSALYMGMTILLPFLVPILMALFGWIAWKRQKKAELRAAESLPVPTIVDERSVL